MSKTQTWRDQDERRFELSRSVAELVLVELNAHLPVVTYGQSPATMLVATLYFDTVERYYLERARAGGEISSIKVRAREYFPISDNEDRNILDQAEHCFLERKERTGTIREKYRVRIDKKDLAHILARTIDLPDECGVLRDEMQNRTLEPAVISMYERRVWGSDNELRVTLDERIRYYRPPKIPYAEINAMTPEELGEPVAFGPKRILEVKHAAASALPEWLAQLLETLPEATGFSKFLDGMDGLSRGRRSQTLTRPLHNLP